MKTIISLYMLLAFSSCAYAVPLQPHRAYYTFTQENPNGSEKAEYIEGKLAVEVQKSCNGWVVQQMSESKEWYSDGESTLSNWGFAMWESDDHRSLRFNSYRKVDGIITSELRGTASKHNGLIQYALPEKKYISLDKESIFPIEHIERITQQLSKQASMTTSIIFDGSRTDGEILLNTFIGPITSRNSHQKDILYTEPFIPTQMAIFEPTNKGMIPNYEVYQEFLLSGIVKYYSIAYDTYTIKGTLERVELLPDMDCDA